MWFYFDWRYDYQDICWNVHSLVLKLGLEHSPFYFYNIGRYFALIEGIVVKKRTKTIIWLLWNRVCNNGCYIFRTLEVILRQLKILLIRYRPKHLFVGFEIMLTAFTVLFFEKLRLFGVDWRYVCQDTCKNVCSPALKLGLRHLSLYF